MTDIHWIAFSPEPESISSDTYQDLLDPSDEMIDQWLEMGGPIHKQVKTEMNCQSYPLINDYVPFQTIFNAMSEEPCDSFHTTEATTVASPASNEGCCVTPAGLDIEQAFDFGIFCDNDQMTVLEDLKSSIQQIISEDNQRLIKLITKSLTITPPSQEELQNCTPFERAIINAIVEKKFPAANSKGHKKREEEKQKLFFKGAMKYTEAKFFEDLLNSKKKIKRKQIDRSDYYQYYWGETAHRDSLDLTTFFHPNKRNTLSKTTAQISLPQTSGLKTLNTTYIELILRSDRFRVDAHNYLKNVFAEESLKSRTKKVGKMVGTLQAVANKAIAQSFNQYDQIEFVCSSLHQYIISNPKCKLPWSDFELRDAMKSAKSFIDKQDMINEKLF